ncbi:MAG: hypothetical protein ABF449_02355 [Ethanoligenens sp.]
MVLDHVLEAPFPPSGENHPGARADDVPCKCGFPQSGRRKVRRPSPVTGNEAALSTAQQGWNRGTIQCLTPFLEGWGIFAP